MPNDPDATTYEILAILGSGANAGYMGEPVSQLEHALQAAAAARRANASDDQVLAALLHDIGHLIVPPDHPNRSDVGVIDHDRLGEAWLRDQGFGETVAALVGAHVDAKRYLVARNPAYREALSPATKRSLVLQGGPMTGEECIAFDRSPFRDAALRVRSWDESAKVPGAVVATLETYRATLTSHLTRANRPQL